MLANVFSRRRRNADEQARQARRKQYLDVPLTSSELTGAENHDNLLLTVNIFVKGGAGDGASGALGDTAADILADYIAEARNADRLLTAFCEQNPADPRQFLLLERYADDQALVGWQRGEAYKTLIKRMQPLLEQPLGVHLCKERGGQLSLSHYP